jgi:hypothetical protein
MDRDRSVGIYPDLRMSGHSSALAHARDAVCIAGFPRMSINNQGGDHHDQP